MVRNTDAPHQLALHADGSGRLGALEKLAIIARLRLQADSDITLQGDRMNLRLLVLGAAVAATNAVAAPRGFSVEDLVRMERIGHPVLSADATRAVYTVRSTDIDKNRGHTELWMIDLRTPKPVPQRLTNSDASNSDPEFSPQGDAIYFLSARSGSSQVWRLPTGGGEAVHRTEVMGRTVSLTSHRHDPSDVVRRLDAAGFVVDAPVVRAAVADHESTPQAFVTARAATARPG